MGPSSSSDLREQLQRSLGTTYALERELGGGGMSRVFLAEETRLGRRVVVKVLAPELAAEVSPQRFEREMRMAARLQHPNIVPVLTAGDAAGVPYYTMPWIEGESLRARLERGALPLGEAVGVLRDVMRAIAYAHAHGVVHRDIKPANVLLSGDIAMVTDFGIAKALTAARTTGGGPRAPGWDRTLTEAGESLGTPAYMAPEQAAGEAVDGRADLYAWGVVAWEVLGGRHPFAHASGARGLLAAHLGEAPTPLRDIAPDVPPALADLVTHCLAKDPAERPPNAHAVLAALDAATSAANAANSAVSNAATNPANAAKAAAGPRVGSRRRTPTWWAAAIAAVLLTAIGVVAATRTRLGFGEQASRPPSELIVADFADEAGDSTLARTVAQALRIDLARSPRVILPSAAEVREGLAAMRADTAKALTGEIALTLAQRTGRAAVLDGAVLAAGSGYVLTARLVAAADGNPIATFRESAVDSSQVIAAIDRLSRAVRREVGESMMSLRAMPPLAVATTHSLPALAAFTRMVDAQAYVESPAALEHGRQAVALDPEFAEAWRRIGSVLGNLRVHRAEQVAAISRAHALRARLSRFEQGMAEASYHWLVRGDHRQAAERLSALTAEFPVSKDPRRLEANTSLSLIHDQLGEWDAALRALQPLADSARLGLPGQVRYVRALIGVGRLAAADSAVDAMARAFPGPFAGYVRMGPAVARRDYAGALAHVDSILAFVDSVLGPAALRSGRVQAFLLHRRVITATLGQLDAREQIDAALGGEYERFGAGAELLRISAEMAEIEGALGHPDRAVRRLDAALARHPLAPMAALDRPYPALAAAWASAGRPDRAEALLAEWSRAMPAENQPLDSVPVLRARILVRLAQGRAAEAERLARDGFFGNCGGCRDVYLARAFDARGATDSTLAAYERYLAVTPMRELTDPTDLARAYRRLGELYEARGDVAHALQRYREFVELWKGADAGLQPAVEDVRARIRRLQARAG